MNITAKTVIQHELVCHVLDYVNNSENKLIGQSSIASKCNLILSSDYLHIIRIL